MALGLLGIGAEVFRWAIIPVDAERMKAGRRVCNLFFCRSCSSEGLGMQHAGGSGQLKCQVNGATAELVAPNLYLIGLILIYFIFFKK